METAYCDIACLTVFLAFLMEGRARSWDAGSTKRASSMIGYDWFGIKWEIVSDNLINPFSFFSLIAF